MIQKRLRCFVAWPKKKFFHIESSPRIWNKTRGKREECTWEDVKWWCMLNDVCLDQNVSHPKKSRCGRFTKSRPKCVYKNYALSDFYCARKSTMMLCVDYRIIRHCCACSSWAHRRRCPGVEVFQSSGTSAFECRFGVMHVTHRSAIFWRSYDSQDFHHFRCCSQRFLAWLELICSNSACMC